MLCFGQKVQYYGQEAENREHLRSPSGLPIFFAVLCSGWFFLNIGIIGINFSVKSTRFCSKSTVPDWTGKPRIQIRSAVFPMVQNLLFGYKFALGDFFLNILLESGSLSKVLDFGPKAQYPNQQESLRIYKSVFAVFRGGKILFDWPLLWVIFTQIYYWNQVSCQQKCYVLVKKCSTNLTGKLRTESITQSFRTSNFFLL